MTDNAKLAEALTDLPTADWSPYRPLILHALRKDPAAPNRIAIGQFVLRQSDAHENKVWIFTSDGEGGIFDAHKLSDLLGDFYAENF